MPMPIYRLLGARSEGYECLMAMSGLAWAITLAMPLESFLRFDMRAHAAVAPLWIWAIVAGTSGGLHFIGLLCGRYQLRLVACWLSMPFWWLVFAIFTSEFPYSTSPAIYFVHAVLGSWACVLMSRGLHGDSE